jgi:hypothetical protein
MNVQVTEEAYSSQKRPSNTSKHELFAQIFTFVGHFALLDPDPDPLTRFNPDRIRIRIRIRKTGWTTEEKRFYVKKTDRWRRL